jgi:glycosyltransferase involved in cell wall biosynthesis
VKIKAFARLVAAGGGSSGRIGGASLLKQYRRASKCLKYQELSNSIMEYMACELPVICTDSGGNRELVVDGETGFIIPPEDVDSFTEKLLFLKNNPDISHRMGNEGYN